MTQSNQVVFNGIILDKNSETISLRVSPGVVIEVKAEDVQELEEATDEVTRRAYVRIQLKEDAEFRATFQSKLARLAEGASGVPFGIGGQLPQSEQPVTPRMMAITTVTPWGDRYLDDSGYEPTIGPAPGTATRTQESTRSRIYWSFWADDDNRSVTYWDN